MNNKLMLADAFDICSYVLVQNITTTDILNWIYTIILIISILLGIILKIVAALKDHKITKEEAEEIQKAVNEAKDDIKAAADNKKEDK